MKKINQILNKYTYELTFVMASGAVISSLLLSSAAGLYPCTLCWWQRIFMFPLPLILGAAVLRKDKFAFVYVIPLALIGVAISAYHSLLQWGVIVEKASTCSLIGPSCSEPEILIFGFLTIPFGAFLSFLAVTVLMYRLSIKNKKPVFEPSSKKLFTKIVAVLGVAAIIAYFIIKANVST